MRLSRVTSAVDASGAVSTIAYDGAGRIASRTHGGDTLTYQYGSVNHAFGVHTGDTLKGPAATLVRQLAFDGFGQPSAATTLDADGRVLLASSYGRDALGRVVDVRLSSQASNAPVVNLARTAVYDGINQLLSSTTAYGGGQPAGTLAYVYDGNYNVLARTEDGASTRYTYNAIGQLTSGGVRYDANGRMTADGMGASYAYNALDQLVAATRGGGSVAYAYHPDGAMARRSGAGAAQAFYYDSGAVNAVASDAGWTSFLLDATLRRGAYGKGAPGYYVAGADSTAMLQAQGGAEAIGYDPYGLALDDAGFGAERNFTWNQEYSDPATSLVWLRTRNYHPGLMRFCSMDSIQQDNRYAYARGNPLNLADPSGHMDTGEIIGLVAGAVVGLIATVATGGVAGAAAAAIFGTESVAASVGATALAGAVGAVAGDAANAGISHQQFTAQRALVDILSGAVGGAVGAGAGGVAGRSAMSAALAEGMSQRAITNIGLVCSGVVGGVAGAAASSGVTSSMTGTPFFSAGTALSMVLGAAAGAGGGFLTSGAYLGKMSAKMIPVPLGDAETHLIVPAKNTVGAVLDRKLFVMAPQDDADASAAVFAGMEGGHRSALTLDYKAGSPSYDTIAAHGAGNTMFASVEYRPNGGAMTGEPNYVRPIKGSVLARWLADNPGLVGGTGSDREIKLMSCFGAFSNAQTIAATLQRPVQPSVPIAAVPTPPPAPLPVVPRKVKIGLALGGGAARGFAHIGVIKALEAQGIVPRHRGRHQRRLGGRRPVRLRLRRLRAAEDRAGDGRGDDFRLGHAASSASRPAC
jgi:RHS repeat-associated protein